MKKLILLPFIISCIFLHGQNIDWAVHAPGISGAPVVPTVDNEVARDGAGNIYFSSAVADSTQIGAFIIAGIAIAPGAHLSTGYIGKADPNGNVLWVKTLPAQVTSFVKDILADVNGDLYVLGDFFGSSITLDTMTLSPNKDDQMFLAKFDSNGSIQWAVTSDRGAGSGLIQAYSMSFAPGNKIAISGYYDGTAILQGQMLSNPSSQSFFMATYRKDGSIMWARSYGFINPLHVEMGIGADASGDLFLTGSTIDNTTFDTIPVNGVGSLGNYFLAKFDSTGNIYWIQWTYGRGIEAADLKISSLNEVYVTGTFSDTAIFGANVLLPRLIGYNEFFLVKYDNRGAVQWVRQSKGAATVIRPKDLAISSQGNIYACGSYGNHSGGFPDVNFDDGLKTITLKQVGVFDGFIVKYFSDGSLDWAKALSGAENDDVKAIVAENNVAYVTGILVNTINIGDTTFIGAPTNFAGNFFLAACNGSKSPPTTLETMTRHTDVIIYPNPGTSIIHVSSSAGLIESIEINDLNGRQLGMYDAHVYSATLNVENLQAGTYFVKVKFKDRIEIKRLILAK